MHDILLSVKLKQIAKAVNTGPHFQSSDALTSGV